MSEEFENTQTGQKFILPTYSGNLNRTILNVIESLHINNQVQAWEDLQTLYFMLPPDCESECSEGYEEICNALNQRNKDVTSINRVTRHAKRYSYGINVLRI